MPNASKEEMVGRAAAYAQSRRLTLHCQYPLGAGIDGCVWRTSRPSALKICERTANFADEVEAYRRLRDHRVRRIHEFAVPWLIEADAAFLAIEMSIVSQPFVVDFGKVYFDAPPPYWDDAEVMSHWHAEGQETFGPRWPKVLAVIAALQRYGIWYVDPKPGNIMFGD